jgi:KipI family sensor histidine kinase inhibitor
VTAATTSAAPRIREAGDSALLLELPAAIDPDINARAIAIAAAVRREAVPGVRDVVSTYRSVAVFFDPLIADARSIAAALHRAGDEPVNIDHREAIEIEVAYGGEAGPDLDDVARSAGCTPQQVIERHTAHSYRVFMLGFLPGFAYMGTVDDSIAVPRRATPRLRVPAGSVGIAGRQTGIYPCESPGGWQIIGRTSARVFDPRRAAPALFSPGDDVTFVSAQHSSANPRGYAPRASADPIGLARSITVLRPGLLTTIQDEGRWGYQHEGVSVSGAMDIVAHRTANALIGNPRGAATLEITILGPQLRLEQSTVLAVTGADMEPTSDGAALPNYAPVLCRAGSVISFGQRRTGARAYLAFGGGIDVSPVLGSRSTHLLSGLGGVNGAALHAGDRLPLGAPTGAARRRVNWSHPGTGGARLRVLPGPQEEYCSPDALDVLQRTRFSISPQSDRMGYRLSAARGLNAPAGDMISDVTFAGGIQVPPSGQPILLMADRQTTGGYPQIATVISADLPAAGQLAPGDWVEFEVCTLAQARAALVEEEGKLLAFS